VSEPTLIRIDAFVDPGERLALLAAAHQLSGCLGAAAGAAWSVQLVSHPPGAMSDPAPEATGAAVVSLLPETARLEEPIEETERRWRSFLQRLTRQAMTVSICTVFRHIAEPAPTPGRPSELLDRIRRLDLMAARLSHSCGVGVIDIDRALAHVGALPAQTDYRLGGRVAAEVAGHQIVWNLLSLGLDAAVPPALQEKAKAIHGDLGQIDALLKRRLSQPLTSRIDG